MREKGAYIFLQLRILAVCDDVDGADEGCVAVDGRDAVADFAHIAEAGITPDIGKGVFLVGGDICLQLCLMGRIVAVDPRQYNVYVKVVIQGLSGWLLRLRSLEG